MTYAQATQRGADINDIVWDEDQRTWRIERQPFGSACANRAERRLRARIVRRTYGETHGDNPRTIGKLSAKAKVLRAERVAYDDRAWRRIVRERIAAALANAKVERS